MSNKSDGTKFEHEFAKKLAFYGFWVHNIYGNMGKQPFDVIAAKNGQIYAFECKVCRNNIFRFDRLEENQKMAMKLFMACGNENAYLVFKSAENNIYLFKVRSDYLDLYQNIIITDCINLEEWGCKN